MSSVTYRYLKETLKLGPWFIRMETGYDFLQRFNSLNFLDFECVSYNNRWRINDSDICEPTGFAESNHG